MQMQGVPFDVYPSLAHLILPFLEIFAKDGAQTAAFFETQILERDMQCWIGGYERNYATTNEHYERENFKIKVVCLTEIGTDDLKTCHVSYCAGEDHKEWGPLMEKICLWAKENNCARVRATTRPGYERLLAQHSFRKTHIVLDRVL